MLLLQRPGATAQGFPKTARNFMGGVLASSIRQVGQSVLFPMLYPPASAALEVPEGVLGTCRSPNSLSQCPEIWGSGQCGEHHQAL